MEKLIYLLWRDAREPLPTFAKRVVEAVGPALLRRGACAVVVHVADAATDLAGSVPVRDEHEPFSGMASFWLPSVDARADFEAILAPACARIAGYLVTESVPRDFDRRDWPDGARCPGSVMISAFPRPERLPRAEFIARWHDSHTPLALEVHPLWRYVRNVVARELTLGAPAYAGIVEEHVRTPEELSDPVRFYGGAAHASRNIARILDDAKTFLDLEDVMSVVTSAYILS